MYFRLQKLSNELCFALFFGQAGEQAGEQADENEAGAFGHTKVGLKRFDLALPGSVKGVGG